MIRESVGLTVKRPSDELLKVVSTVITKNVHLQDMRHYLMSATDYWSESILCALLMELLCTLSNENVQEGYTIGILSVIGKTVINRAFDMFGDEEIYDKSKSYVEWETGLLGFSHAHAGAILLKRWDFPVDIIGPVKYQFDPDNEPDDSPFVHALYFTRKLLEQTGIDLSKNEFSLDAKMTAFLKKSSISEEDLLEGLTRIREKYGQFKSDFGI